MAFSSTTLQFLLYFKKDFLKWGNLVTNYSTNKSCEFDLFLGGHKQSTCQLVVERRDGLFNLPTTGRTLEVVHVLHHNKYMS